jgi:hypothetical protein
METKCIDIGFLHEAVQKVEKKGEISKDLFFETSLVQKEGEVSFWQSVKRFFGYQPQGWKLNPDIISQHTSDIQALVVQVCPSGTSLYRVQYYWESAGYDVELFNKFLVVALYIEAVTAYQSRIGLRLIAKDW